MLTIIVGNSWEGVREDIEPDMLRLMPNELVEFFDGWLARRNYNGMVRVYNDTLINYVGELIERRVLDPDRVRVITEEGIHFYNDEGVLGSDWPYGIFNYHTPVSG